MGRGIVLMTGRGGSGGIASGAASYPFADMSAGEITAAGWVTDGNVRTLGQPVNMPLSIILKATTGTDEGADQCAVCASGATDSYARIIRETSTDKIRLQVVWNGVTACDLDCGAVADATLFTLAARIDEDDFAVTIDAGTPVTDTSGTPPPNVSLWTVGAHRGGTLPWGGTVEVLEIA